jgi:molybdopterin converting factor subunit 1
MTYQVQFFARARELAETSSAAIDLPPGATVRDLKDELKVHYPRLEPLLARSTVAVDEEYATDDQTLPADATLALIPPVSGG